MHLKNDCPLLLEIMSKMRVGVEENHIWGPHGQRVQDLGKPLIFVCSIITNFTPLVLEVISRDGADKNKDFS